jgi:hypothetical protein
VIHSSLCDDIDRLNAAHWARWYADFGFNPLPACTHRSCPAMTSYTKERDEGFPPELLARWWTPCVQICTGLRWNLVVIDLDGVVADDLWSGWAWARGCPPTWTVLTPGGGKHLWFRPSGKVARLAKSILWSCPETRHEAIELLADGGLAMAPPSYREYPDGSRRRYVWADGLGPHEIAQPAPLPGWVLDLVPRPAPPPPPELRPLVRGSRLLRGARLDSRAVLDAIANKAALARAWGLRIVSAVPNVKGWLRCRAIGREDRHPSAGFHAFTGYYNEPFRLRYSLFELGSVLGPYEDWRHCRDSLAALVGITPEVPCS